MRAAIHSLVASIKVPRNQTALMQLLQLYVQAGHYFWTSGVVHRNKLASLIEKLAVFRIGRDKPGRVYDKTKGLASTHFITLDSADGWLPWVLVSTAGKGGLADSSSLDVGVVHDTRLVGQHLIFKHYELLHAEKVMTRHRDIRTKAGEIIKSRKETLRLTTWSWRMSSKRFREHEALIVSLVKQRDAEGLEAEILVLMQTPLFSGVRGQVLKLFTEIRKLCGKFRVEIPLISELPYMVRLPLYTEPPETLLTLFFAKREKERAPTLLPQPYRTDHSG